jgi:hypothetical protein
MYRTYSDDNAADNGAVAAKRFDFSAPRYDVLMSPWQWLRTYFETSLPFTTRDANGGGGSLGTPVEKVTPSPPSLPLVRTAKTGDGADWNGEHSNERGLGDSLETPGEVLRGSFDRTFTLDNCPLKDGVGLTLRVSADKVTYVPGGFNHARL